MSSAAGSVWGVSHAVWCGTRHHPDRASSRLLNARKGSRAKSLVSAWAGGLISEMSFATKSSNPFEE